MDFWNKPLQDLNESEWERLCDGCGRCCLKKFSDEESEQILYTRVICRYFDPESSRCGCYDERTVNVPDCIDLKRADIASLDWMPTTCAYRLRFNGQPLPDWHPLLTGSRSAMEAAGISVSGRSISEEYIHPEGYGEHIIKWVES